MYELIRELPFQFPLNYDYLPIVILSLIVFLIIYQVISPKLSAKLSKSYSKLPSHHKLEWNIRFTSTIFSIVISTLSLYVLIVDHALASSPLMYDSVLVKTNIAIVMGYTMSDIIIMIANYRIIGDAFTLIHHFIALFGYSQALMYSCMPYFVNLRLIVELSTPLVNMRWFLYAAGFNKDSLHFFVNGIAMAVLFFTVRIASIPIYWYKVYSVVDSQMWAKMRHFRYILIVTCLILDIINIYWFKKIFKGALIVWTTNWQYYEKHHKSQQLEMLIEYRELLKNKILFANNVLKQSTIHGLNKINPKQFIERNVYMPRVINDILSRNQEKTEHHVKVN